MKKTAFLFAMACLMCLSSCQHKQSDAEALQSLQTLDSLTGVYFHEEHSEAEYDSVFNQYVEQMYSVAQEHLHTDAHYFALQNAHYYFSTEQKHELIDCLTAEEAEANELGRMYESWMHECETAVGNMYIDFGAPTPAGDSLYLHDLVGKSRFIIIDFWASWCGPCRASMPELRDLNTVYAKDGHLQIVGVSLDNDRDHWLQAIEGLQLPWLHMSDLRGWACEGAALYGVSAIPATVILDSEGRIVSRDIKDIHRLLRQ